MSFISAVKKTPLLKEALKPGLKALGANSSKIRPNSSQKCEGSVDIDAAVRRQYPNSPRWDYALGYDGKTHLIEVHPAETHEVASLLKKLQWVKNFLAEDAPKLNEEPKQFHWIASGRGAILPNSPQARRLAKQGIKVIGQLILE